MFLNLNSILKFYQKGKFWKNLLRFMMKLTSAREGFTATDWSLFSHFVVTTSRQPTFTSRSLYKDTEDVKIKLLLNITTILKVTYKVKKNTNELFWLHYYQLISLLGLDKVEMYYKFFGRWRLEKHLKIK